VAAAPAVTRRKVKLPALLSRPAFVFRREGCKPIEKPSERRIRHELRFLWSVGKSSWASLRARNGNQIAVAGGKAICVLEYWNRDDHSRLRAWQEDSRVVPADWQDDTQLPFSGGLITMKKDEWVRIDRAADAFAEFLETSAVPSIFRWRLVTFRPNLERPIPPPYTRQGSERYRRGA